MDAAKGYCDEAEGWDMTRRHGKTRIWLPLVILLVSSALCVLAGVLWHRQQLADSEQPKDMQGNSVTVDGGDLPSGEVLKRMAVTEGNGSRLVVPSVGLDVALGELSEVNGQITPPGFTSAYLVRNRGAGSLESANQHTVYVVTHSVNWGKAPGNYLIDVADAKPAVAIGAEISIGDLRYKVTDTSTVLKTELGKQASVWEDAPGKLELITCLQREQGKSLKNVIITAQLQ
jgi:hypothetical protein